MKYKNHNPLHSGCSFKGRQERLFKDCIFERKIQDQEINCEAVKIVRDVF